jgi:leader peptidase (prepilin peptidase)/N-methyltransferase
VLLVSPFIGSFLGLLAERLPRGQDFVRGRSQCDSCSHRLAVRDLLPVASWLWLRGRCRYCRARIGLFAPIMEIAAFGIALWASTVTSGGILLASCLLGWWLLVLVAIDWNNFLLPDALTLPLALAGIVVSYVIDPVNLPAHLIGALAGFLVLALVAYGYARLRGREGLGLGDAKLMGALGAWLSWQGLPSTLLFAAVAGLLFVLLRSAIRRPLSATDPIAFGAFLALGGWLVWLYGPLVPQLP